jgi:hypothetical protein
MTRDILPRFFFIKAAPIPSPSAIRRISRGIGISLILANSEKQASRSKLREAMTMQRNTRLHQCAQNLQDQKLLAK